MTRTWPALRDAARLGLALRGRGWETRRGFIFGPYYTRAAALRRVIPRGEIVAIVPRHRSDRDLAMFCIYAMYPTPARIDDEESARRIPRPRWVIVVDQSSSDVLTLSSR
ncbi:MAG TPA: hypothetical protein VGJ81_18185 [Thermoanaerobaculia bacterium]